MSEPAPAASPGVAHRHLTCVLLSELDAVPDGETVRVLDAGCGDGRLLECLCRALASERPGLRLEPFGFDVLDHGVQAAGFLEGARARLARACPDVDWSARIAAVRQDERWPYPEQAFDVVLSNQVLEHVMDHDRFVGELARTLARGGWSAHVFPLRHYLFETHLNLPFVHRISDHALREAYIRTLSRFGLGKFRAHHRDTGVSLERFAEAHADYMLHQTNYLSTGEVYRLAKRHGLRTSFRHTRGFYRTKIRRALRRPDPARYARGSAFGDWLSFFVLRYVSCVTLFLERQATYHGGDRRERSGRDDDEWIAVAPGFPGGR